MQNAVILSFNAKNTLFEVDKLSKFSKLAFKKSASLFCCCWRGVSGFGGGLGDGGGTGIEFDGVGDSLVERASLLLFEDTDSNDGVKSTEGGREGGLGVELEGGGCDGGAILVVTISLDEFVEEVV